MANNRITKETRISQNPFNIRALGLISFITTALVLSVALAGAQQDAGATGTQSAYQSRWKHGHCAHRHANNGQDGGFSGLRTKPGERPFSWFPGGKSDGW